MPPRDVTGPRRKRKPPPRPAPNVFGPPRAVTFKPAQRAAKRKVERAQRALPERALPATPTLAHPTQKQIEHASRLVQRSLRRQGPDRAAVNREVLEDPRSRARVRPVIQGQRTLAHNQHVREGLREIRRDPGAYGVSRQQLAALHRAAVKGRLPEQIRGDLARVGRGVQRRVNVRAGASTAPRLRVSEQTVKQFAANPLGFLTAQAGKQLAATGAAFWEHPGRTTTRTAGGLAQSVIGIPAALGELSRETGFAVGRGDVGGVTRALSRPGREAALDYQRRYSGSIGERAKRIEQEGAAAELTDLATALTVGGATAGRALVGTARGGALGARAQRFTSEPRPRLRYSGGTGVREQQVSNRISRIAVQRAQDKLRARASGRRDSEGRVRGLQPQATAVEKSIGRQNQKRAARGQAQVTARVQGEVTPIFRRSAAREQRIAASRGSARSYIGVRHEGTRELNKGTERELADLSPRQRRAVFHVSQGLVPLAGSIEEIRAVLGERRAQIVKEQKAAGVTEPKVLRRHTELRAIEFLDKHADDIFKDDRLARFHEANIERSKRLAEGDQAFRSATGEARRYRPQGEFLGIKYEPHRRIEADPNRAAELERMAVSLRERAEEQESSGRFQFAQNNATNLRRMADEMDREAALSRKGGVSEEPLAGDDLEAYNRAYAEQVRSAAEARGLPEPAYFKHAKRLLPRLSLRTGGNVSKGMAGVHRSDLKLFREGRAVTNPDILVQGLAENIKRKHQWNAVADVVDEHAFSWSRGKSGGQSISSLQDIIDRRGLRHEDIAFLDLGVMRKAVVDLDDGKALHDALTKSIYAGSEARSLARKGEAVVKTRGYVALPKAVADELLANTRPPSKALRVLGKAQGLQSAAILGLNPSFLQVQVAANVLQGGAAIRGQFADLARGQAWYRHLDEGQRKVVDEALGVGVFEGHTQVARLGSTAGGIATTLNRIGQVPLVRTGKGTVRITDLNPTQGMFRADDAQNKLFRRAVLYNALKREAFGKLAKDVGRSQASMRVLADWAELKPGRSVNDAAAKLLANPEAVERAARHVDDALGDYLRFTAKERQRFKPFVMFYGFFRYALRTAFYTLPAKHPLLGAIGLKLGQLHNEELRRIFGSRDIPSYALSRGLVFDRQGRPVKTPEGTFKTIDYGRINPLTSPATELVTEGPQRLLGVVSPALQSGANLVAKKNVAFDRPLTLHGLAAEPERIGPGDATRVFTNQTLSALFPYRAAMSARSGGRTQSDDALLWDLRPITYKTAAAQGREDERIAARGDTRGELLRQLAPLAISRVDRTAQQVRDRAEKEQGGLAKLPPAQRRVIQRQIDHAARRGAGKVTASQQRAIQRQLDLAARRRRG